MGVVGESAWGAGVVVVVVLVEEEEKSGLLIFAERVSFRSGCSLSSSSMVIGRMLGFMEATHTVTTTARTTNTTCNAE